MGCDPTFSCKVRHMALHAPMLGDALAKIYSRIVTPYRWLAKHLRSSESRLQILRYWLAILVENSGEFDRMANTVSFYLVAEQEDVIVTSSFDFLALDETIVGLTREALDGA